MYVLGGEDYQYGVRSRLDFVLARGSAISRRSKSDFHLEVPGWGFSMRQEWLVSCSARWWTFFVHR